MPWVSRQDLFDPVLVRVSVADARDARVRLMRRLAVSGVVLHHVLVQVHCVLLAWLSLLP